MAKIKLKIWQLGVVRVPGPDSTPPAVFAFPGAPTHAVSAVSAVGAAPAANGMEKNLLPGYYLMLYLRGVVQSIIDSRVRYFGPFMTATEARFLQTSAVALGIVESAVSVYDVLPMPDPQPHFLKESP